MANSGSTTALKKLARRLLTTTCLTVAATGAAHASVFTESSAPGSDFPASFGAAYVLPQGTTEVQGSATFGPDTLDFFEFTGLLGGSPYSFANIFGGASTGLKMTVYNSSQTVLNTGTLPANFSGTIPGDGVLVMGVDGTFIEGTATYDTTLTAQQASVPEPGTLGTMGLALAGALAWRRKRSK